MGLTDIAQVPLNKTIIRTASLYAIFLAGCAIAPTPPPSEVTPPPIIKQTAIQQFSLNGRLSIKYDDQGFSGGLRWQHQVEQDDILISGPLGQGGAQIIKDKSQATLIMSDRTRYTAQNAEQLMQQVLGWHMPLDGLPYWIVGQAMPDAPAQTETHPDGTLKRLTQNGWQVDYLEYKDNHQQRLPSKLNLKTPEVQARIVIDEWLEIK